MTDYEKGSAGWDIGAILTRHTTFGQPCAKVLRLRANTTLPATIRLEEARATPCTCGAGDSPVENTSPATTQGHMMDA